MKYKKADVRQLGTILGVWAHPDDESWCSAGIMADAIRNSQRVAVVTATYGAAGQTADEGRWPKKKLAQIRKNELAEALKIIGVTEHSWLGYEDGRLQHLETSKPIAEIAAVIARVKPDTILTFGPDGITGHKDHCTISDWTLKAVKRAGSDAVVYGASEVEEHYHSATSDVRLSVYFNTKQPKLISKAQADLCFEPAKSIAQLKLRALSAHASQTRGMFDKPESRQFIEQAAACECFMRIN